MKVLSTTLLAIFFGLLALFPAQAAQPNATQLAPHELQAFGAALAKQFFDLLVTGGSNSTNATAKAELEAFLDPGFQAQRSDGSGASKSRYVPPVVNPNFTLINSTTTAPADDVVVVRYFIRLPNETAGNSTTDQPRLSTFLWSRVGNETTWRIISHANFDPPQLALCKGLVNVPVSAENYTGRGQPVNPALANALTTLWFELLKSGNGSVILDPAGQIQRADGTAALGANYTNPSLTDYDFGNMTATTHGGVLVARYDARVEEVIAGFNYSTAIKPRLTTFLLKREGWKIVANANFDVPVVGGLPSACGASGRSVRRSLFRMGI